MIARELNANQFPVPIGTRRSMPIKFRCNYCRQFLGISRAQAGGIVDCPTCGRSIRVPQLDGSLQPLPEPELNLQDAHLARALDELARLATGDSQPAVQELGDQSAFDEDAENEIPQPIPEPIPIEVPIPPTPISINPPLQGDDSLHSSSEGVSLARPSLSKSITPDVLEEFAALSIPGAPSVPPPVEPIASTAPRQHQPRQRSLPHLAWITALAFVAGMLFERFVKILESPAKAPDVHAAKSDEAPLAASTELTGRITYKSADGSSQPDRGARVLAFPQQRDGEVKLSVVGFRPADSATDAKVAAAALQALGGGVAAADDNGQYRLDVPAGSYELLILSHYQPRDETTPVDPALRKLLAEYFDQPDTLPGRVEYEFGPLRVKGTGDIRDHSF